MRISKERQASESRVAIVRVELSNAIARVGAAYPALTYEEVLAALLIVAERQVGHMRDDEPDGAK